MLMKLYGFRQNTGLKGLFFFLVEAVGRFYRIRNACDELEPPFEGIIDYGKVRGHCIAPSQIEEKQLYLAKYSKHFLCSSPAPPLGPEDLAWRMIAGKLVNIKLHIRRSQRLCVTESDRAARLVIPLPVEEALKGE
ncbi:hypothetical protein AKJ16_DCAP03663 [Drosera capensis]